jgi:NAD-dependent deacetylase
MDARQQLAERIADASRLTILTGAGVSAASGVPTFRGDAGLWRNFRPEELATPDAFRRDPTLVWEWYAWRQDRIRQCAPNVAHRTIAAWSHRPGCTVITQNVDDLHLRAGTRNLIRLHGSIWELKCWQNCGQPTWRAESDDPRRQVLSPGRHTHQPQPPHCPSCGGLARPAVIWFGESLDAGEVEAALDASACDLFLTIGTSAVVYPAAGLVGEAKRRGAFTAEINPDQTPASNMVDLSIRATAEELLPELGRVG